MFVVPAVRRRCVAPRHRPRTYVVTSGQSLPGQELSSRRLRLRVYYHYQYILVVYTSTGAIIIVLLVRRTCHQVFIPSFTLTRARVFAGAGLTFPSFCFWYQQDAACVVHRSCNGTLVLGWIKFLSLLPLVPAHFKDPSSWLTISLHINTTQKTTGTRL